ncbi:hypothetical protein J437_LFUL016633 [Ladona fulva]|uniref:Uncharacterized protein n=1 Tax=Ladona fulva TaxID=123851 RepID=A0A8K0KKE3_LADFU|nr:hypothetical protein J437_LFUL016633 [Ladona fulva]
MDKTSIDGCLPKSKLALDTMPKEEIELNVAKELQVKRALEIQEKPSISVSHSPKVTAEDDDLTKEMDLALDFYVIDELHQGFDQSEKYFLKYFRHYRLSENEKSPFKDLIEEIEVEYDSIDAIETKGHGEEVIYNDKTDETSKAGKNYSKEIEPYYAFANNFTDFYSWIRYLDLYNLFPASVLYDQHVNLMPRGNTTNFAIECEAKFLTRLSKDTPETEDGSK